MKRVLFLAAVAAVSGCQPYDEDRYYPSVYGTDTTSDLETNDTLDGTWLLVKEHVQYKFTTKEHVSTHYFVSKYTFEETDNGVKYEPCAGYGGNADFGLITDEFFYLDPAEDGYWFNDDGSMSRVVAYEQEGIYGYTFDAFETLYRLSDEVAIDDGTFTVDGPIQNQAYHQVCLYQQFSTLGHSRSVELRVPFENDVLTLEFDLWGEIAPGTYQYADRDVDESQIKLDMYSSSRSFTAMAEAILASSNPELAEADIELTGPFSLEPRDVEIVVIQSSDLAMSGSYSFTGVDDERYSGEFELRYFDVLSLQNQEAVME